MTGDPVVESVPVPAPSRASNWMKRGIAAAVGLIVMIAVFAFLFPKFADYGQALTLMKAIPAGWIAALIAASLLNILIYPMTANAAITHLPYRAAFTSRSISYSVSNVIPGGGAVSVATQYAILAGYKVPPAQAAAAVTADGVWTTIIIMASPALAIGLLLIEGDPTGPFQVAALIGAVIVVAVISAVWVVLRSDTGAQRLGAWAQKIVDRVFGVLKRPAPHVGSTILDFHEHAAEMVRERWRSITVTNIAAQFMPFLILLITLHALGVTPRPVSYIEVFAAFSVALLLTSVPITPGGLGTVDAALVALLVTFGVDSSTALAADLIWRLVWFLPHLLTGLAAYGVYQWDRKHHATYIDPKQGTGTTRNVE